MDGKSMTYHSRGGPLEALASIVAEREGITLGTPNYVPAPRTASWRWSRGTSTRRSSTF